MLSAIAAEEGNEELLGEIDDALATLQADDPEPLLCLHDPDTVEMRASLWTTR